MRAIFALVPSLAAAAFASVDPTSPFVRHGPLPRPVAPYARAVPTALAPGFHRGVCYPSPSSPDIEFGTPGCREALRQIRATGADTVSLCPFFLMTRQNPYGLGRFPGTADRDAAKQTILWAREAGLKVVLRPQLVTHTRHPRFDPDIRHREDWMEVFGVMDVLLRDLAELAEETHVEALSLGTRLEESYDRTPQNWPILIRRVREVYHGRLTYDADWRREVARVPFWDLLDFASITLYKRLGEADDPDDRQPDDMELFKNAGWPTGRLSELAYRLRKPVWISELGLPSSAEGVRHPYQRPVQRAPADPVLQGRALAASLLVYQDKRWLSGVMVWGFTGPGGPADGGYCPQGKPAWDVLRRWFATGPVRTGEFRDAKDLIPWIDDWF